jgi:hypothetical protein
VLSRAAGARGGPGAAPSQEREPELRGRLATSELPLAGRREPFLTWSLYTGVPDSQGTDSGPWAHPRRGCEPVGGANILSPRSLSESL